MDKDDSPTAGAMTPLHRNQIWLLRLRGLIGAVVLTMLGVTADLILSDEFGLSFGPFAGFLTLLAVLGLILLPKRRYRAWGYREEEDELHIRHGLLIRYWTVVPFGRVQHLDVASGPIERRLGLATLILHTAGTRSATVALPGLSGDEAEKMRDRIRAKIRQDLV